MAIAGVAPFFSGFDGWVRANGGWFAFGTFVVVVVIDPFIAWMIWRRLFPIIGGISHKEAVTLGQTVRSFVRFGKR